MAKFEPGCHDCIGNKIYWGILAPYDFTGTCGHPIKAGKFIGWRNLRWFNWKVRLFGCKPEYSHALCANCWDEVVAYLDIAYIKQLAMLTRNRGYYSDSSGPVDGGFYSDGGGGG